MKRNQTVKDSGDNAPSFQIKCSGKEISQNKLREIWGRNFAEKPFPKVRAFNVNFKDLIKILTDYGSDSKRQELLKEGEKMEYGESRPMQTCDAFTLNCRNGNYIIFRKTTSTWSLDDDLKHESNIFIKMISSQFIDELMVVRNSRPD